MEALTAVSVACLTLFDMLKAVDRTMEIGGVRVTVKDAAASRATGRAVISFDEALALIIEAARPLGRERVALGEAHGRVLAAPVTRAGRCAALRRLGDGRLCGARRRSAGLPAR